MAIATGKKTLAQLRMDGAARTAKSVSANTVLLSPARKTINKALADVSARMRATKEAQIAVGETLRAIQAQLNDVGEKWEGWAEKFLGVSTRTARRWIEAYLKSQGIDKVENQPDTVSDDAGTEPPTESDPQPSEPPASPPPQSDEVQTLKDRIKELAAIRVAAGG